MIAVKEGAGVRDRKGIGAGHCCKQMYLGLAWHWGVEEVWPCHRLSCVVGGKELNCVIRGYKGAPGRPSSWIELRLRNPGIEKIDRK